MVAIGLPSAGAPAIWRWEGHFPRVSRWVAVTIFGIAGLVALSPFLLNRQHARILAPDRANCLMDGAGPLGLFLLDTFFAIRCAVPAAGGNRRDFI